MSNGKNLATGLLGGIVGASLILGGNYLISPNQTTNNTTTQSQTSSSSKGETKVSNIDYDISNGVTAAVDKLQGTVVSVINLQYPKASNSSIWGSLFGDDEGIDNSNKDESDLQPASEGSGVIYKKADGKAYIVTNNHVVAESEGLEIQLSNGTKVKGTLVGADSYSDLAVISIPDAGVENVATFGNSDKIKVGEPTIAIGSPLGTDFANSVTSGIISAINRNVVNVNDQKQTVELNAIQTDAAINPGNSGGALANIAGEVIGINSAKMSSSGATSESSVEGMGFAIPSNDVVNIINQLEKDGEVKRPGMGVYSMPVEKLNQEQRTDLKLPNDVTEGVCIINVTSGWPAENAGLKSKDVIVKVGDKNITTTTDLTSAIFSKKIGDTVEVTYYRNGKKATTTLELTKEYSQLPKDDTSSSK